MIILVQFLSTVVLMLHYFSMIWDEKLWAWEWWPSFKKKKKSENEMIILVHTESECLQVAS